jgi:hypothetical protein
MCSASEKSAEGRETDCNANYQQLAEPNDRTQCDRIWMRIRGSDQRVSHQRDESAYNTEEKPKEESV